ncbi:hypothetical protein ACOT81_17895 [Streptomyces sp. WI04-05B]|uniref:hypothetical protein n=1 Tax=Streptomyces TaxID=1883 RepID=UPI0029ADBA4B|nr:MULTISPECIES: hypothetical protein [unclassified Streptomyces]MDX2542739.1 hypothetical protein [Streptomyces sp. WI04-05B]MDX2582242.1 hypothetical protein [Streptomyces sp. WI04-05A]
MESNLPFPEHRTVRNVGASDLEIRFFLGDGDDPASVDNVDAVITAPDGMRWSATLLTRSAIDSVMDRWATTGECLGGQYFQVRDLVLVREPGLDSMARALGDIFDEYGLDTNVLPKLGPADDEEEEEEGEGEAEEDG